LLAEMSRATTATSAIRPASSRIGEIVIDTSIVRPSFVRRTVSTACTGSPSRTRERSSRSSSRRSGGTIG
jgi:hypothetical protein